MTHPATVNILKYFSYQHLPAGRPREASELCHDMANVMAQRIPESAELTAGLRKLLEAKDCFVRASLP